MLLYGKATPHYSERALNIYHTSRECPGGSVTLFANWGLPSAFTK